MDIKTRFSVGDTIKVKASKWIYQKCPFCEGKGFRLIENSKKFYCQNCDDGQIKVSSENDVMIDAVIDGMMVEIRQRDMTDEDKEDYTYCNENGFLNIEYYVDFDYKTYDTFRTISETKLIEWNK